MTEREGHLSEEEFRVEIYRLLLSAICVLERYWFPDKPTTSKLRKAGKKVCQVDVNKE
mgnify:CR=1 FL=1